MICPYCFLFKSAHFDRGSLIYFEISMGPSQKRAPADDAEEGRRRAGSARSRGSTASRRDRSTRTETAPAASGLPLVRPATPVEDAKERLIIALSEASSLRIEACWVLSCSFVSRSLLHSRSRALSSCPDLCSCCVFSRSLRFSSLFADR